MTRVTCPTCQRPIDYSPSNNWRPFCSERCKLIDLGEWAAEKHAIPCAAEPDFLAENPNAPTKPNA